MTPLAAYMLLFLAVGVGFIFVHLVLGKLIRPSNRSTEKETIYECGEPTIGSAWIQFDLRFYVVALLFVIFDVEVAFFFPWAEVFGKANALRDTPAPQTAEEYRTQAKNVLAFGVQPTANPALKEQRRERLLWQALANLKDEELAAVRGLPRDSLKLFNLLGGNRLLVKESLTPELANRSQKQIEMLRAVTPEQLEVIKKGHAELEKVLNKIQTEQQNELPKLIAGVHALPPGAVAEFNKVLGAELRAPMQVSQHAQNFLGSTVQRIDLLRFEELQELAKLRVVDVSPMGGQFPGVIKEYQKQLPELYAELIAKATLHHAELTGVVKKFLADLGQAGPTQTGLWNVLTVENLKVLSEMNAEHIQTLALSPATLAALSLDENLTPKVQKAAGTLAWLAFYEILVFFGVLLVGFAYLWRRGDLAWVRSTAAETTPQGASRVGTRELEPVGK